MLYVLYISKLEIKYILKYIKASATLRCHCDKRLKQRQDILTFPNKIIYFRYYKSRENSMLICVIISMFTLQFDGSLVGNHDNLLPCVPVN